jgi:hypothetical protein
VADHVFGHGRLTHFDSNLQQFPMNARRSPARVGVAHLTDEIANFRRYRRAAIAMPTFPSPSRNPWRCHPMTVSGLTISSAGRLEDQ